MDLKPGKPYANGEGVSAQEGRSTDLEDKDRRGETSDVAGEPLLKSVTRTNAIPSSKTNTPVGKEFTFQEELPKIEDSLDTMTEESIQEKKNPMLIGPIIRCIFGFLDIEDAKNFRFVSREWSSVGKIALATRALIRFKKDSPGRLPIDFYLCFRNSAPLFSSFQFYGGSWAIEGLSKFFYIQKKSIKKLALNVENLTKGGTLVKHFDISAWISKSPMVKSNVKYLTNLSISEVDCAIPLSLLKHIKDLSLSYCRVNLETEVQINPVKLYLQGIDFYQDGTLPRIKINDIFNFSSASEIFLNGYSIETNRTTLAIDLSGTFTLESLTLLYIETINWKTSKWDIGHMRLNDEEFPTTQMTINELYLSPDEGGEYNLFAFPQSIEKLGIGESCTSEDVNITCSEPTTLENLKYFSVAVNSTGDYSFLAHFMNCPQLTHLKFFLEYGPNIPEIKLTCIPKAVKTLTLDWCSIDWVFGSYCYANVEKIIVFGIEINFERISKGKISVDDIIFICSDYEQEVPKSVVNFFNHQNPWNLCKRFYIGNLKWDKMKLEDSVLNEHVDTKSAFYVFENGEKGRAFDEKSFYQLADIPKHIVMNNHEFES